MLPSNVNVSSTEYRERSAAMGELVADLRARLDVAHAAGGPTACKRHTSRGKLLARQRIYNLIDTGSPFLELSPLAGFDMYDEDVPSAGIVTGVGCVSGERAADAS